MKRQGKKLTEEETQELLEQRKALKEQSLRKNLQDQAFGLYGQAMERAGLGQEFAEQKALRDAEKAKGGKLSEEETAMVKQLSELSYKMANTRETQLGDTSVKTNSLTARGGFAGGPAYDNKVPKIIHRDYEPGARIAVHRKDIVNAKDYAHHMGVDTPMTDVVLMVMDWMKDNGHIDEDQAAMVKYYEDKMNVKVGSEDNQ